MEEGNLKDTICRELFNRIEGQVTLGDTKASLLFAAQSILLTLETAVIGAVWGQLHGSVVFVVAVPVVLILCALGVALLAIIPNKQHGRLPEKLVFSSIATAGGKKEFLAAVDAMSAADMMRDIKSQIHGVSAYAHRKFRLLRVSVQLTLVGLLAWAAALVVIGLVTKAAPNPAPQPTGAAPAISRVCIPTSGPDC